QCSNTGYKGRIGVYEMLVLDERMLDALRRQDVSGFARAARKSPLYRPLGQAAMDYALEGVTSLHEVARVTAMTEGGFSFEEDDGQDGQESNAPPIMELPE
ncbi:MAG: hypothetical protein KGY54_14810, partial [Oleiphilaceae bacterium]|nr:hypothetical protein [Oleiphilaceae bacterium]